MRTDSDTRRQQVLELTAEGLEPREMAERLRLSDRSVRRYLSDPAIAADVRKVQQERLCQLARRAAALGRSALTVLATVSGDAAQPGAARVSAAKAILDTIIKLGELADLAERIAALEAFNELKRPP